MKVFTVKNYGTPVDALQIEECQIPKPGKDEITIAVKATTINDYDWAMITGKPFIYRLMFGLLKPKNAIPGMELSGIVTSIGDEVGAFSVGDKVYGDISDHGFGTYAEYVCINANAVQKMPEQMDFVQATALPHASLLAFQAFEKVGLSKGQRVLINGAGGGVGTIGLQLAKLKECHVTGVDSEMKLEKMASLGFDDVLDYRKIDFTNMDDQYDVILDCKSTRSISSLTKVLNPTGKYITVGGSIGKLLHLAVWGKLANWITGKHFGILALKPNRELHRIAALFQQQKLTACIDGPHSFDTIPNLVNYFGKGNHFGKVVIILD